MIAATRYTFNHNQSLTLVPTWRFQPRITRITSGMCTKKKRCQSLSRASRRWRIWRTSSTKRWQEILLIKTNHNRRNSWLSRSKWPCFPKRRTWLPNDTQRTQTLNEKLSKRSHPWIYSAIIVSPWPRRSRQEENNFCLHKVTRRTSRFRRHLK